MAKRSKENEAVEPKASAPPKTKLKPGQERRIIANDSEVMELQRKRLLCGWNPTTREAVIKKEE